MPRTIVGVILISETIIQYKFHRNGIVIAIAIANISCSNAFPALARSEI